MVTPGLVFRDPLIGNMAHTFFRDQSDIGYCPPFAWFSERDCISDAHYTTDKVT